MKRIFLMLLTAILLLQCFAVPSLADLPDVDRESKLTVTVKYGDKVIPGGFISLYRVADMAVENGECVYLLTEDFLECSVDFSDSTEKITAVVTEYINENKIEGDRRTVDSQGQVTFEGLKAGYYVGIQDQAGEGYLAPKPFSTSLPVQNTDGYYSYIVAVNSKAEPISDDTDPDKDTTIKPSKPGSTLPQTGQLKWPIPILAVCGTGLLIIGCVLLISSKRRRDEE